MNFKDQQTPTTNYNVEQERPNVPRAFTPLHGNLGCSFNGAVDKTIAWRRIMAGTRDKEYKVSFQIQMLTPLTPAYQKLRGVLKTFFVPNSRVHENWEQFLAQKGGSTVTKITEEPNVGGKLLKTVISNTVGTNITNTEHFRDSWISSYIPRIGNLTVANESPNLDIELPKYSALKMRGRVAIYNDYLRNKSYTAPKTEYKGDEVSEEEWKQMFIQNPINEGLQFDPDFQYGRAKQPNSYYTDYRTEAQALDEGENPNPDSNYNGLVTWAAWESKIAEYRSQAENENLTDFEVIKKIRGSKLLTQGKVQLLSEKTFDINYSVITQTSYNTNENINEKFQVMGAQGAYSYTAIDMPLYAGMEFEEDGYIHVILTVYADTVYETGLDRIELNVAAMDQYRPDLKDDKLDTLNIWEVDYTGRGYLENGSIITGMRSGAKGFKRRFNEYFKLPNIINGDITNRNFMATRVYTNELGITEIKFTPGEELQSKTSFQFFQDSDQTFLRNNGELIRIKEYLDYTDLLINKNLAIEQDIDMFWNELTEKGPSGSLRIQGENQFILIGEHMALTDMPIDKSIKHNYSDWGEH